MVKLLDPLGSSEARGGIGGHVYNTWRGINYCRRKVTPANQNTPRRLELRGHTKTCTLRWQLLSDLHRQWWQDYANTHPLTLWTGKQKRIHGYNWFVKTNVLRVELGLPIVDTPPDDTAPIALKTLTSTTVEPTLVIDWTLDPAIPEADQIVDIWLTRPLSAGRQPKIEDAKHLAYVNAEAGTYTTPPLVEASYGVFGRTIREASGLTSPWSLLKTNMLPSGVLFQGPLYPTLGKSLAPIVRPWSNPTNIYLLDNAKAVAYYEQYAVTDHLFGLHFGFNIPVGATIVGIIGQFFGNNEAAIHLTYQLRDTTGLLGSPRTLDVPTAHEQWYTVGGASDLWGFVPTRSTVMAPGFGLDLTTENTDADYESTGVDVMALTVYYTI